MLNGVHVLKNWFILTYQPSHTLRSKNYLYTRHYFKSTAQTICIDFMTCCASMQNCTFHHYYNINIASKEFILATGKRQKSTIYAKSVLHFCYLSIDIKWLKQTIILACINWFTLQHNSYTVKNGTGYLLKKIMVTILHLLFLSSF